MGQRHLQLALDGWTGGPVAVRYRSFMLNQSIPPEGMDFRQLMQAKGGGRIPLESFFDAPRQAGQKVGLVFNFEKIALAPNTLLSHCLLTLASPELQPGLLSALYAAYFEHGQDIGNLETLVSIAAGHGLDPEDTRAKLRQQSGRELVEADIRWAHEHGISGVPFYVINNRYGISGAQPPEVLRNILQEILQKGNQE